MNAVDLHEADASRGVPSVPSDEIQALTEERWSRMPPSEAQEHSLLALLELSQELSMTTDPYRVSEIDLLNFMGHLGASCGAVWVFSKEGPGIPVLLRSFGAKETDHSAFSEACAAVLLELCPRDPRPVFVEELASGIDPEQLSTLVQSGMLLFGLLWAGGDAVGMIALGKRVTTMEYGAFQLKVFEASLHHLGVSLENAILFGHVLEQNRELSSIQEEMAELDTLKEEFQGNLHHELRTPLTVVLCHLDLALDQLPDDANIREFLLGARDEGRRLERLVVNLLDFRDSRRKGVQLDSIHTDVHGLLRDYVGERKPGVNKDLREITLKAEPTLPSIMCDSRRVLQILDELVDNAVKFTPQGSKISVGAAIRESNDGAQLAISVEDDGPGIPSGSLNIVFEAFRQLDGSMTREVGGIGLGLTLARELAENMGGRLAIKSGEGQGVKAVLLLPTA